MKKVYDLKILCKKKKIYRYISIKHSIFYFLATIYTFNKIVCQEYIENKKKSPLILNNRVNLLKNKIIIIMNKCILKVMIYNTLFNEHKYQIAI